MRTADDARRDPKPGDSFYKPGCGSRIKLTSFRRWAATAEVLKVAHP